MAWKNANETFDAMAIYDFTGPGLNLGSGDRPQHSPGGSRSIVAGEDDLANALGTRAVKPPAKET